MASTSLTASVYALIDLDNMVGLRQAAAALQVCSNGEMTTVGNERHI